MVGSLPSSLAARYASGEHRRNVIRRNTRSEDAQAVLSGHPSSRLYLIFSRAFRAGNALRLDYYRRHKGASSGMPTYS